MIAPMRIGIDLGGTKIEAVALDGGDREVLRRRVETPRGDYAATLNAIYRLVYDFEHELGQSGTVGIGMPGAISPSSGLVKNSNSTWLIGRPFARDMQDRLGREVRLENDANCFALSEAYDGAGSGARVVFGVIVGTGTGGGIVVDGKLINGPNAIAGEWGHNPLPWPGAGECPGPRCYCGKSGCIETFLSGPGMSRDFREFIEAPSIVALAARGDEQAEACLRRYEERMARALASVLNVLDPDVIVLGGGMSNLDRLYTNVPKLWGAFVFSDAVRTRLVRAAHGDSSGVRGAARLW